MKCIKLEITQQEVKDKLEKILTQISEVELSQEASELVDDMLELLLLVGRLGQWEHQQLQYYKQQCEILKGKKYKS